MVTDPERIVRDPRQRNQIIAVFSLFSVQIGAYTVQRLIIADLRNRRKGCFRYAVPRFIRPVKCSDRVDIVYGRFTDGRDMRNDTELFPL